MDSAIEAQDGYQILFWRTPHLVLGMSVNQSPSLIDRVGNSIKKDQRSSWTRDHSFPPDFLDEDRGGKAGSKFLKENFTSLIDLEQSKKPESFEWPASTTFRDDKREYLTYWITTRNFFSKDRDCPTIIYPKYYYEMVVSKSFPKRMRPP